MEVSEGITLKDGMLVSENILQMAVLIQMDIVSGCAIRRES